MVSTKELSNEPDEIAPDGSEVRKLVRTGRGSMAHFRLMPGTVSRAVAHRTIDEFWYVLSGEGRMWRQLNGQEDQVHLRPGLSLSLPVGTHLQFRCDGSDPLNVVSVAAPSWPGDDEAFAVDGPWAAVV